MNVHIKIIVTTLAIGIALLIHSHALDRAGEAVTDAGLNRALVTFGVSRSLNGIISVVQGTEVAIEPVGVGMTFTPGQILDPVNDLIERFSTIVLVAGTAFGVQKIAIKVSAAPLYSWLTITLLMLTVLAVWFKQKVPALLFRYLVKATLIAIIIRIAVPVLAISGDIFYKNFLAQQFDHSTQELNLTSEKLNDLRATNEQDRSANQQTSTNNNLSSHSQSLSLIEKAKQFYRSTSESLNVQNYLDDFSHAAEKISENAIRIMVVFIFQTLVFPLLSVWLILTLLRATVNYSQFE